MIRATAVRARSEWTHDAPGTILADTVVLDFDERHRRRIAMTGTGGLAFLLDLPEAIALRGGDALVLDDGSLVEVVAAPEPLIEIRARSPGDLVRLAWHIGNRHISAQIMPKALRIRGDHVIEEMLRGLGATVVEIEAPFDPEGGAYAGGGQETVDRHQHGDRPHDHRGDKHQKGHDHDGHAHDIHGHDGHDHKHAAHDHEDHDHGGHTHDHGHQHDH